jgi:adenylosuccinate lyase
MKGNGENAQRRSFESPLTSRYGSAEMSYVFSPQFKFSTWRKLWVALAQGERALGLPISAAQVRELERHVEDINFDVAEAREKETRHDVMAHVYAYGVQAPKAKGIIHLGATSAYVTDNTDLIQIRAGLELVAKKIVNVVAALARFAAQHRELPALAYTHFQAAQPTTVGKRACLWIQDLLLDLEDIELVRRTLPFLGVKGTTGTQASFLALFDGDAAKVCSLERLVTEKMGFQTVFPVTGQTYPRKFDYTVLGVLAGLGISAHKMAADVRLLAGLKEVEEPFGEKQVGSSAMAYKRNPMRCERMAGLGRFLINNVQNAAFTAADQWLERTLDDSANRRLSLAEGFLAADSVAHLAANVSDGLVVNKRVIAARVQAELPFMATENILMEAVQAGGDRQALHERLRQHSMSAASRVKEEGAQNDLLDRIRGDEAFAAVRDRLDEIVRPEAFVGRATQQVDEFLSGHVEPVLRGFGDVTADAREPRV